MSEERLMGTSCSSVPLLHLSAEKMLLPSISSHVTIRAAIYQWPCEVLDITSIGFVVLRDNVITEDDATI
jgi:hypothetical protein